MNKFDCFVDKIAKIEEGFYLEVRFYSSNDDEHSVRFKGVVDELCKIVSIKEFDYHEGRIATKYLTRTVDEVNELIKKHRTTLFFQWNKILSDIDSEHTLIELSGADFIFNGKYFEPMNDELLEEILEKQAAYDRKQEEIVQKHRALVDVELEKLGARPTGPKNVLRKDSYGLNGAYISMDGNLSKVSGVVGTNITLANSNNMGI